MANPCHQIILGKSKRGYYNVVPMDNIINGTEHAQRELERRIFHLKTLYDLGQEIGFLRCTNTIVKNLLMMIIGTFGASWGYGNRKCEVCRTDEAGRGRTDESCQVSFTADCREDNP